MLLTQCLLGIDQHCDVNNIDKTSCIGHTSKFSRIWCQVQKSIFGIQNTTIFFFLLFMFDNQIRANITVSYFIREGWMVNIAPIRNVSNTKIY